MRPRLATRGAGVSGRPHGPTCPGTAGETEAWGGRGRGGGGAGPRPGGPAGGGAARLHRALTRPFAFRSNVYAVTDPEPSARRRRPGRVPEALPARRSWLHRRPPPIPSTTYACETVNLPECPIMYLFWVLTLCTKTAAQVCFFRKRFLKKKKKDVSEKRRKSTALHSWFFAVLACVSLRDKACWLRGPAPPWPGRPG